MEQAEIHDLSAAYARRPRRRRARGLRRAPGALPECRENVASFQAASAELAYDTDAPAPSPALRERILVDARREQPKVVALPAVAGRCPSRRRLQSPRGSQRSRSPSGRPTSRSRSTTSRRNGTGRRRSGSCSPTPTRSGSRSTAPTASSWSTRRRRRATWSSSASRARTRTPLRGLGDRGGRGRPGRPLLGRRGRQPSFRSPSRFPRARSSPSRSSKRAASSSRSSSR